jgi:hypothetical protein
MRDIYALIYVLQRRCTLACSFLVAGMQRSVEGRRIEDLMERSAIVTAHGGNCYGAQVAWRKGLGVVCVCSRCCMRHATNK